MILTEKKSDTISMSQGHLQCQKIKLNVLNVTKYEDVIFTYKWENVFVSLNGECISVTL